MLRKLAILICITFVLPSIGCVSCPHRACYDALCNEQCVDTCGGQRNGVVAVVVGPDVDVVGWSKLTSKLNEAGYAKIVRVGALQSPLAVPELEKLHLDSPHVRFVVIGYDLGCLAAKELATELIARKAEVDGLIFLDPWAHVSRQAMPQNLPLTIVRSHGWQRTPFIDSVDMQAPNVGHFDLPTHPLTVNAITTVLAESAKLVVLDSGSFTTKYDPTSPPYPLAQDRPAHLGTEWDFILGPSTMPSTPSQKQKKQPEITPDRTAIRNP